MCRATAGVTAPGCVNGESCKVSVETGLGVTLVKECSWR